MSEAQSGGERWLRRPPWWVYLLAAAAAVLMGITTTHEVRGTDGFPVESVAAQAATKHHPVRGCGKGGGVAHDVVWRSQDAPAALPREFETPDVCLWEAGDRTTAVRQLRDDGSVAKVWLDPTTTYGDAVGITVTLIILVFLAYYLLRGLRLLWLRYLWHD